jgi:hypothetical protein
MADGMNRDPFAPLPAAHGSGAERDTWAPILPAPHPLPETIRHPRLGTPSATWHYRDADGALLFVVCRFDPPGERKEILPLSCGADGWRWRAPPEPRPLYGLDRLAARPDAPVLVVEGEKAADAAATIFPDFVAATWPGGSGATDKADWRPLEGRHVTVWPDHDAAGAKAADALRKALAKAKTASVGVVMIPADWPEKWDLADVLPPGATAETLRRMVADAEAQAVSPQAEDAPNMPRPFYMRASGVWWQPEPIEGGREAAQPVHVCGPLRVVAATNNGTGQAWGALLEWEDADGRKHQWAMPRAMLAGDGQEVRSHLLDGGLFLGSGRKAREKLAEYLMRANPGRAPGHGVKRTA